jgi:hypothetical protein
MTMAWGALNLAGGSGYLTGILPGTNGGTGTQYVTLAGPTGAVTWTGPNASATILTNSASVTVPQGGTGLNTLTAHGVLLGEGTSNVATAGPGASGSLFTGSGSSADPAFLTNGISVGPASAVGGSTPYLSLVGAASETDTGAVLSASTGSGSTQPVLSLSIQGNNALAINEISAGGAQQQTVFGVCPATPDTTDVARIVQCMSSTTATDLRVFATSSSYGGKALQVETETAAGSGFELISGRVGCSSNGSCGSGYEVFNVLGNGVITLGTAGQAVGTVTMYNATSGSVSLAPTTGALGTVTATLPANTGTIAELNLAQTYSAVQTFNTSDLVINGGTATAGLATVTVAGVVSSEANATIAQGGTNATSAAAGTVPNATSTTASSWTATPTLGVEGTTAGTLTLAAASGSGTVGEITLAPASGITLYGSTSGSAALTVSSTGVLALPTGTTATNMSLTTPTLGTPASGTLTNASGLPESGLVGASAAATITEGGATYSVTRAGIATANLTAPWVFQNTNSTNNNTSITMGITAPGTSTGQTVLNINGASTGGDLTDWGTGGTWTAGVLSGQTIVASVTIAGEGKFGASAPAPTTGTSGGWVATEGTAFTGTSTQYGEYNDSTLHCVDIIDQTSNLGCAVGEASILGANLIPKASGTTSGIAASSITDDGKNITTSEVFVGGNKTFVTSDYTDSTSGSLQAITGLSYTLPTSKAVNVSFHCMLLYYQTSAAVVDEFGIGVTGTAPTQANASATAYTNTTASTTGTLTALASTTPTSVVSFTPSAITTIWKAELDGTIEQPSNATPGVFNVYAFTTTGTDNLIVKRGSYCEIF